LGAVAFDRVAARDELRRRTRGLLVIAAVWLVVVGVWAARVARNDGRTERLPSGLGSRRSELAEATARLPAPARVFSNGPWALYWLTNRQPIALAPGRMVAGLSQRPATVDQLVHAARCGSAYLAWFGPADRPSAWAFPPSQ